MAQGDDVPFVVTPDHVTREMLRLAGVTRSDFVIDLGSGDGRIVIAAARLHGARGLGVEIVPDLVAKSRDNARRAGVAERTEFRVQDLFSTDLSRATVITMYLLPEVNLQLRPKPAGAEAGHAHRLARLGPGRLAARPQRERWTYPTNPSGARSARDCTCGPCRRRCRGAGAVGRASCST